jgi:hypothetical protein
MKKIFVLLLMLLMSVSVDATDNYHSVSTSQTGGRYEIIQSDMKRSLFFKLDKFSGDVYQYVKTSGGGYAWQKLYVEGKVFGDLNKSITYQLFLGGIAAADCILLNIETGETYKLYEDHDTKELYFSKFE